jgi:hypothetical protein
MMIIKIAHKSIFISSSNISILDRSEYIEGEDRSRTEEKKKKKKKL